MKHLIVNADDFGQSAGINRGIITAREQGIVTSGSLMVRWPYAPEAAAYARAHPEFSVGLHLDFGEWVFRNDEWQRLYEVVDTDDEAAVRKEVANQIAEFRSLVGRNPTHIDSHQHTHRQNPALEIVTEFAKQIDCPLRQCSSEITYVGGFYGQTSDGVTLPEIICVEGLLKILRELPEGVSELGCHPGFADDLETMYRDERLHEIEVLCDPRIKTALAELGIELTSFADLKSSAYPSPGLEPGHSAASLEIHPVG